MGHTSQIFSPSAMLRILASASGAGRQLELLRNQRRARQINLVSDWHRRNEIVFVHIPKTAGSSIRRALGDPTPHGFQHTAALSFQTVAPDFFDRALSFAVIRDPIARFCSAVSHLQKNSLESHDPIFHGVEEMRDLDLFLHRFETSAWFRARVFAGLHFQKQWYFVSNWRGELIVDELMALEHLEERLPRLLEPLLGKRLDLGHANVSRHYMEPEDISPRVRSLLERHYRQDFKLHEWALASRAYASSVNVPEDA